MTAQDQQVARNEADLREVEARLWEFEARYGMSSDIFWLRYQAGQMSDDAGYVEWNVLCKMHQRLVERLALLETEIKI